MHLVPFLMHMLSSLIIVYIYEVNFSSIVRQKSEIDYAWVLGIFVSRSKI